MKITSVMIDPGHGGIGPSGYVTPGKRYVFSDGRVVYEGDRMRLLACYLAAELRARDLRAFDALTGDEIGDVWGPTFNDVPLRERVAHANALAPAELLYLSLHSNAVASESSGPGQTRASGISVYTSEGQTGSDPVATAIHEALATLKILPMRSASHEDGDPDYEAGFYVLRNTRCRAVLLELGFHDNPHDAAVLLDDEAIADFASVIADAVADFGAP